MVRRIRRILAGLGGLALLALILLTVIIYASLPRINGSISVGAESGLTQSVEVVRDERGVPHIRAETVDEALFALGFVHAQDRFWQMEMMRRAGAGRLAEIVGEAALPSDKFMRVLGLYRLAERQYKRFLPNTRRAIDSYVSGVNAWMQNRASTLPPEFLFLMHLDPEPWTPADSLVWGKMMAMQLTGNWRDELLRARMGQHLKPAQMAELWPTHPAAGSVSESLGEGSIARRLSAALPRWAARPPMGASNAWVVGSKHSTTGKPLLANDPHLGFRAPVLWYMARMEAGGLNMTGATVPGVPFVVLGHNGHVAWGMTTTQSDTADLFVEKLVPGDPGRYVTPEGAKAFETRTETISVKGGRDIQVTVRESRHGPVISDLLGEDGQIFGADHVVALQATFLRDGDLTPQALFGFNKATGWPEFRAALADFHAPQQNVVFADKSGETAFYAAGKVPRRRGGRGEIPRRGWTGEADWTGFVPFRKLPSVTNPLSGRLISANNKIVDANYPYFLSNDWDPGYRAQRIRQLLDAAPIQSLDSTVRMQRDHVSLMAMDLLPLMTDIEPDSPRERRVIDFLKKWNGLMSRRRSEPLIFSAWLRAFNRTVFADELGEDFADFWGYRPRLVRSVLTRRAHWCDDTRTGVKETCADALKTSLQKVLDDFYGQFNVGYVNWRWGDLHVARFDHPLWKGVPVFGPGASMEIDTDGGNFTINRGAGQAGNEESPFAHVHGAGFRAVYDLADLRRSRFMIATGQSGNPVSSLYGVFLKSWRDGGYVRLGLDWRDLEERGLGKLTLDPR